MILEKNKLLMIIIIAVLVIVLAGVGFGFVFTISKINEISNNADGSAMIESDDVAVEDLDFVYLEEPVRTNLAPSADGSEHLVSIDIAIALGGKSKDNEKEYTQFMEKLNSEQVVIRNTVLRVLRNKTIEELKGVNSEDALSEELLSKLRDVYKNNFIVDIYFGDYFLQ